MLISQKSGYPKYVAEHREGRYKGRYPTQEVAHVPSLRRMWDRGGLGSGTRLVRMESDSPEGILEEVRQRRLSPQHDDIQFYIIRAPGSSMQGVQYQQILSMTRQHGV